MPRRRAAIRRVSVTDVQEAGKLQVLGETECRLDIGCIESAGPESRKAEVGRLHHHRGSDDACVHHTAVEVVVVLFGGIALGLVVANHEHHRGVVGHTRDAADFFKRLGRLDDLHGHGLRVDCRRGNAARLEHLGEFFGFHRLGGKGAAAITILGQIHERHKYLFLRKYKYFKLDPMEKLLVAS